jgi:hypothetical protein
MNGNLPSDSQKRTLRAAGMACARGIRYRGQGTATVDRSQHA